MHSALFRDDFGALTVRRFASAADARAASAASGRELAPEVRPHPCGGWTHARPAGGTARTYAGNWPTRAAAQRALGERGAP